MLYEKILTGGQKTALLSTNQILNNLNSYAAAGMGHRIYVYHTITSIYIILYIDETFFL